MKRGAIFSVMMAMSALAVGAQGEGVPPGLKPRREVTTNVAAPSASLPSSRSRGIRAGGTSSAASHKAEEGKERPTVQQVKAPQSAQADSLKSVPRRPVHTYSIVARDAATGELGVAVQSHWFSVGSIVTWAEAGVGAIATQSFVDPSYGMLGLDLLRAGKAAPEALKGLLAADEGREVRQVAMIDAQGRVAAHTGKNCIPAAGHHVGKNYSVQANLMDKATVWPAMARAFEAAEGDLADRLFAALEAAEREGGDIRGKQSAAMLIVKGVSSGRPWAGADVVMDLRVEDHAAPLVELKRLMRVHRAYVRMNNGDLCAEKKDWDCASREYAAAEKLLPEQMETYFWHAVTMATAGRVEEALPLFKKVFAKEPKWAELVERLPGVELLPKDAKLLERIKAQK